MKGPVMRQMCLWHDVITIFVPFMAKHKSDVQCLARIIPYLITNILRGPCMFFSFPRTYTLDMVTLQRKPQLSFIRGPFLFLLLFTAQTERVTA